MIDVARRAGDHQEITPHRCPELNHSRMRQSPRRAKAASARPTTAAKIASAPVVRANGRPTLARAEQIRSAILVAALAEFAERGFQGAGIAGIAARANVTRATVYNHFSSKEAMLEQLHLHTSERLRLSIEKVIDPDRPIWEVLQDVGRCFYKDGVSADAKAISRVLIMESDRIPELVRQAHDRRWYALEPLANYFETLSLNGKMSLDDAPRSAQQFMHLVTSSIDFLFSGKGAKTTLEQESWIASAVRVFLHGALRSP